MIASIIIISLFTLSIIAIGQTTVADWSSQGIAQYYQGNYDDAINAFGKAIEVITQEKESITITLNDTAPKDKIVKIVGIDATTFPRIKVSVFIKKICAVVGNLKIDDFRIQENNNDIAIDNLYFMGNATGQQLDFAVVFDNTTSMNDEIRALKLRIKELIQKINSSNLDTRYSLVTFSGSTVVAATNWTNDAEFFITTIGKLSVSGGNLNSPENSLDGIEKALSFGFRPNAQKILLVVTDEPSHQKGDGDSNSFYLIDDVRQDLSNDGVMLIAVSPDFNDSRINPDVPRSDLPKYADMRELAHQANGLWVDISSADFFAILNQLQEILTGTYIIEYTSPEQVTADSRAVSVFVNALPCAEGSDLSVYTKPEETNPSDNFDRAGTQMILRLPDKFKKTNKVAEKQITVTIGKEFFMDSIDYQTPLPGKTYLVLPIQIENMGYDSLDYNSLYCKVTVDNVQYSNSFLGIWLAQAGYPSIDDMVTLKDGGIISGYMGFEVPKGTSDYEFVFEPISISKYNIIYIYGAVSP